MNPNEDEFRKGLGLAARIGTELVASVVVGAGLGYLIDRYFQTDPWFMVAGLILGAVAGVLSVYRITTQNERK